MRRRRKNRVQIILTFSVVAHPRVNKSIPMIQVKHSYDPSRMRLLLWQPERAEQNDSTWHRWRDTFSGNKNDMEIHIFGVRVHQLRHLLIR